MLGAQFRLAGNYAKNTIDAASKPMVPQQNQSESSLKALEAILRKDQIQAKESMDSEGQGGAAAPTPQQAQLQTLYAPQPVQYNYRRGVLGDYSRLINQSEGLQSSAMDGFILSTLESRRGVEKIADDSPDSYNMLANTFGLEQESRKNQKRALKRPRLSAMTVL